MNNDPIGISKAGYKIYPIRPSTCGYRAKHVCNYLPAPCLKGKHCDRFFPIQNFDKVNSKVRMVRYVPTLLKKLVRSTPPT